VSISRPAMLALWSRSRSDSSTCEEQAAMTRRMFAQGQEDEAPAVAHSERSNDAELEWRGWMQDLGRRNRRLRDFLGLSQEHVARLAGVSQGAVSRLETARGLATPLLIVLKINAALMRELRRVDPSFLSADPR